MSVRFVAGVIIVFLINIQLLTAKHANIKKNNRNITHKNIKPTRTNDNTANFACILSFSKDRSFFESSIIFFLHGKALSSQLTTEMFSFSGSVFLDFLDFFLPFESDFFLVAFSFLTIVVVVFAGFDRFFGDCAAYCWAAGCCRWRLRRYNCHCWFGLKALDRLLHQRNTEKSLKWW